MIKWILIIWFATSTNYSYVPVVVSEYTTQESCQHAANSWIRLTEEKHIDERDSYGYVIQPLRPRAICLPKQ
jgi:hypothetical protein